MGDLKTADMYKCIIKNRFKWMVTEWRNFKSVRQVKISSLVHEAPFVALYIKTGTGGTECAAGEEKPHVQY